MCKWGRERKKKGVVKKNEIKRSITENILQKEEKEDSPYSTRLVPTIVKQKWLQICSNDQSSIIDFAKSKAHIMMPPPGPKRNTFAAKPLYNAKKPSSETILANDCSA